MTITAKLEPTAKLRWVPKWDEKKKVILDYNLQQWWSNEVNVRMGPTQMIKGEWRDVPMEEVE
jgi:hypothetical protein